MSQIKVTAPAFWKTRKVISDVYDSKLLTLLYLKQFP